MLIPPSVRADLYLYESGWTLQYCDVLGCHIGYADGLQATVQVKPETLGSSVTLSEWVSVDMYGSDSFDANLCGGHCWIQAGIFIGTTQAGFFTSSPILYEEVKDFAGYSFTNVGPASFGTQYTFRLYENCLNSTPSCSPAWYVDINGINVGSWTDSGIAGREGTATAFLESHDPQSGNPSGNGDFSNLQFFLSGNTLYGPAWYQWGNSFPPDILPNTASGAVTFQCFGYWVYPVSSTEFTVGGAPAHCAGGGGTPSRLQTPPEEQIVSPGNTASLYGARDQQLPSGNLKDSRIIVSVVDSIATKWSSVWLIGSGQYGGAPNVQIPIDWWGVALVLGVGIGIIVAVIVGPILWNRRKTAMLKRRDAGATSTGQESRT